MSTTVRLTVLEGPHQGRRFCFRGPSTVKVGRASDCFMCFAGDVRDEIISRHHCQLYVVPPSVCVRDLGSLNGTYVNGRRINDEAEPNAADQAAWARQMATVNCGDIITLGCTSLRVDIVDCPPKLADGIDPDSVWLPDEVAKKDCPIACPELAASC